MSKAKTISWIIALPFILIAVGVAFCEANKAYWDHQVKLMCEKDGGVTIYEKVEISKADYPNMKFISTGQPILPADYHAKPDDPFFYKSSTEYLHKVFPDLAVVRHEQSIVRNADKKVLATAVSYGRGGGDFPTGIIHPSHYSCENQKENSRIYESTIAVKGE